MEHIIRPRAQGKTTECVLQAARHSRYIVCPNQRQCRHVEDVARQLGVVIPKPITFHKFVNGHNTGRHDLEYIIDNLDMCLHLYGNVATVSYTDAEPAPQKPRGVWHQLLRWWYRDDPYSIYYDINRSVTLTKKRDQRGANQWT